MWLVLLTRSLGLWIQNLYGRCVAFNTLEVRTTFFPAQCSCSHRYISPSPFMTDSLMFPFRDCWLVQLNQYIVPIQVTLHKHSGQSCLNSLEKVLTITILTELFVKLTFCTYLTQLDRAFLRFGFRCAVSNSLRRTLSAIVVPATVATWVQPRNWRKISMNLKLLAYMAEDESSEVSSHWSRMI